MKPVRPIVTVVAALALSALALGACVAAPGAASPGTGSPNATVTPPAQATAPGGAGALPSAGDTLVLQVRTEGGFVAPDARFGWFPSVSVYADGRIIMPGAQIMIYPGPLLPAVEVARVPLPTVRALLAEARAVGLASGVDRSYPPRGVADIPDTVFVVWSPAGVTTTRFGALGMNGSGAPAAEEAARRAAQLLAAHLTDPSVIGTATSEPYVPAAVRLLVRDAAANPDGPAQTPVLWPLATPLASLGTAFPDGAAGARCGVVSGPDLATLWPVLSHANTATPFISEGRAYQLVVRPLLPDEAATC